MLSPESQTHNPLAMVFLFSKPSNDAILNQACANPHMPHRERSRLEKVLTTFALPQKGYEIFTHP